MKKIITTILAAGITAMSLTATAQSSTARRASSAKHEILVCYAWNTKYVFSQEYRYTCGLDKQKMTIDQVYAQGYRLISTWGAADTNTSPQVNSITLYFEKERR